MALVFGVVAPEEYFLKEMSLWYLFMCCVILDVVEPGRVTSIWHTRHLKRMNWDVLIDNIINLLKLIFKLIMG